MESIISNLLPSQYKLDPYIVPLENRPNTIPRCNKSLPVIDFGRLHTDPKSLLGEIMKACIDFGFFQVTGHGVEEIMHDMLNVAEEFFKMPVEDKMEMFSDDQEKVSRLHSSRDHKNLRAQFWRDSLAHPVNPPEDFKHLWPAKPETYRQIAETYSRAVRSFGLKLLELISEGLGIRSDYLEDELTKEQLLTINHYPPCPDPSLTLGLPRHHDPNTITIVQQGVVSGLQVFVEGEWTSVEPVPNALIINIGRQLQFVSNGRIQSVDHRAVTNTDSARTTLVTFFSPSMDCTIQPAEELVDESNPQKYKVFKYKEFMDVHIAALDDNESVINAFMA